MARKECVRFGQRAKFLGKKNAFRRALDNSKRASLAKSNRRIAAKVSRARKTEGGYIWSGRTFRKSRNVPTGGFCAVEVVSASFVQTVAAGGASVDESDRCSPRRRRTRAEDVTLSFPLSRCIGNKLRTGWRQFYGITRREACLRVGDTPGCLLDNCEGGRCPRDAAIRKDVSA